MKAGSDIRYDYLRKLEICAKFPIENGIEPIESVLKERKLVAERLLTTTLTNEDYKQLTNLLKHLNSHIEIYFGL